MGEEGEEGHRAARFLEYCGRMRRLRYYLVQGSHHPDSSKAHRSVLLSTVRKDRFRVDGTSTLYYKSPTGAVWQKVITSEEERDKILYDCHSAPFAGHSGINATTEKICHRFYWQGIKEDVKNYIEKCEACQKGQKNRKSALSPIPTEPAETLCIVGMDFFGPLPETCNGHRYIFTLTDCATKWVECYPLKEMSGVCVAGKIQNYISRYGVPKELLSDQGEELVNHVNSVLAENLGIERMVTSSDLPLTNGLDERTRRMLKKKFSHLYNEKCKDWDWDDHTEAVAFSLRPRKDASRRNLLCALKEEPHSPAESPEDSALQGPDSEDATYAAGVQYMKEGTVEPKEEGKNVSSSSVTDVEENISNSCMKEEVEESVSNSRVTDVEDNVSNSSVTEDEEQSRENSPHRNPKRKHELVAEDVYEAIKSLQQRYNDRDEHQHFGDLIACKLRKLSSQHARNTVQNLIQNILYKAEQGHYDIPTGQTPVKPLLIYSVNTTKHA